MKDALIRLGRVLLGQIIAWAVAQFSGVNIPLVNISVGAVINAAAKYLRDKYGWTWLPV